VVEDSKVDEEVRTFETTTMGLLGTPRLTLKFA
jgi:hypothetical protein